ncbi:hypothetical protein FH972_009487 [Carpinus fangiana]|uniref:DNA mismatch repair protein S5 domain-containing protein n=1 Tax=Carpinus fangiana TaxID=176857 RepID=A0A660KM28_9ROSI|nr:hypothetical protein FH972_009487 [Carpinus fangiana]
MADSHTAEELPRGTKRKADEDLAAPRRIKALDADVVNKIAAGEIIVAPVHALKELIENAVDAGATSLEIVVKDGGLKLLQITDNGHGINQDDLPILCERFTTSKLKAFEDLTSIGTYGFRGEALASISHIAHLQITTRTNDSSCAWRAHYSSGKLVPVKPGQPAEPKAIAGRRGTQITVEDLFYNVPTRRRAFRSASEEYNKILDLVGRYAVHCSGVAFSCKRHGDASMGVSIQAAAETVDRIRQIHSSGVANELIHFETADDRWGFSSDGWISNANYHVKKTMILLFINHRSVENTSLKRAVEQTYATFLPKGGHPFIYLSLDIDPKRVDVNVHPTKREVNFLNEDEIIEIICEEIRVHLAKVDTSRTYVTQSLLPGVRIPTIGADTLDSPTRSPKRHAGAPDLTPSTLPRSTLRTPASKPYENNLVRTDSKIRKITSMFQRESTSSVGKDDNTEDAESALPPESMDYEYTDREPVVCRLASVKQLRAHVRDVSSTALTDVFATHTFVGIVDEDRRIVALQAGVKLFLVDYGMILREYFYQVGLTDFANFGQHRLEPPLDLRAVLRIAADLEKQRCPADEAADTDWDEVVEEVATLIISKRELLLEYFSLEVSAEGELIGLPLLIKDYTPSLGKLPGFLLRLGPAVDWSKEKECFHTFLRELASWYTPESLPKFVPRPSDMEEDKDGDKEGNQEEASIAEDPLIVARRNEINRALENVLLPALKSRLIATKGMAKGVIEVANLKGLYRVFERC